MRDHIISEIRRLTQANEGQPPGQTLFARETGIGSHVWRGKHWARWGDALVEAGYAPNSWTSSLDPEEILKGVVNACRHYGRLPTRDEMNLYRETDPSIPSGQAIKRHFGLRSELIGALLEYASRHEGHQDIVALLPSHEASARPTSTVSTRTIEGFVYLIKSGDFYKIGRSDDLERRVKQITIALPEKATLVHSIRTDDPVGIEAYWHRRFAEKRANGEWFKLSSLDVSAFKKRKFQ